MPQAAANYAMPFTVVALPGAISLCAQTPNQIELWRYTILYKCPKCFAFGSSCAHYQFHHAHLMQHDYFSDSIIIKGSLSTEAICNQLLSAGEEGGR